MPVGGYTDEQQARLWQKLIESVIEGGTISQFCRDNDIARATVWRWYSKDTDECRKRKIELCAAEQLRADMWIDEIIGIADDTKSDIQFNYDNDGNAIPAWNKEHINRTRLRIDTRKWIACKHFKQRYGDSQSHEISGPNGGPMVYAGIDRPKPVDYEQWRAIVSQEGRRTDEDDEDED